MNAHLQYAGYVIRHKWFVLLAGWATHAPTWRLLIHDWSKLTPAEWGPYVREFYDPQGAKQPGEYDRAWLHHIHRNPHHWQHWLLKRDDGNLEALAMPVELAREMVADWIGATRAINGHWDINEWYDSRKAAMSLHPDTRKLVEQLIANTSPPEDADTR